MSTRTFILCNLFLIILGLLFYAAEYFKGAETRNRSQVELVSPASSPASLLGTRYRAHRHEAESNN